MFFSSSYASSSCFSLLCSLLKQARFGDCSLDRPGLFDPVGGAKWDAWNGNKGLAAHLAQEQYVAMLRTVVNNWHPRSDVTTTCEAAASNRCGCGGRGEYTNVLNS